MESGDASHQNGKGDKENDKLLNMEDCEKGSTYGNVSAEKWSDKGNMETHSMASSPHDSSISHKPCKEKYLKKLQEEEILPKTSCKKKALKIFVTILFIIIIVGIVIIWSFHEGRSRKYVGTQFFDFVGLKRLVHVYNMDDRIILRGFLKTSDFQLQEARKCFEEQPDDLFCFIFEDRTVFRFYPYMLPESSVHCIDLKWENIFSELHVAKDCYDMEYGLWYGLPNFVGSFWPLKLDDLTLAPISYQPYRNKILGNVLENFWLSTEGIAIVAHQKTPMKVSYNMEKNSLLCLWLDFEEIATEFQPTSYNYSICKGPDIKETFKATRKHFFPRSHDINYENHDFSKVIWKYTNKVQSSTDNLGEFLHKLNAAGLDINMLQYDSVWEKYAGDFRVEAFTRNIISQFLKGKYSKTKLMLPLSLACSYLSENFKQSVTDGRFIKDSESGAVKMIVYKDQSCALWDASSPDTRKFLQDAMNSLQQVGTPEETRYPEAFVLRTTIADKTLPYTMYRNTSDVNAMNKDFTELFIDFGKSVSVEMAYNMQNLSVFVEIPTIVANKSGKKCLDYIISGALSAGIHGYPYVITVAPPEDKVDQELFMRWVETAMFFPGLKVTNAAVNFGDTVTLLIKNMSVFRQSDVIPLYSNISMDIEKGYPLIRPIWWINPNDYKTLQISDQFLIGDSMVVAPILCHGDRSRDVYLPEGNWIHTSTRQLYSGRQWLKNFPVPLNEIAVFQMKFM